MKNIVFKVMIALFLFMSGSLFNSNVYAENVDIVNKGFSLDELKGKTSFNYFIPKEITKDWNIELKYPEQIHKNMEKVQIHFLNREGTQLKVAIIERAATSNDIQLGVHGERVRINNIKLLAALTCSTLFMGMAACEPNGTANTAEKLKQESTKN